MDSINRKSRKFRDEVEFQDSRASSIYYLLPFRFEKINKTSEVLVNEVGDYLFVPTGTAEEIILKKISRKDNSDLYQDLLANFFISETPVPAVIDIYATRYRTKKHFLSNFTGLHIFVISLRCEHTCSYCQVSRVTQNKDLFDMSLYHIDKGIEIMFASPNPYLTMEFQGGEALLAFDKIKYAEYKKPEK